MTIDRKSLHLLVSCCVNKLDSSSNIMLRVRLINKNHKTTKNGQNGNHQQDINKIKNIFGKLPRIIRSLLQGRLLAMMSLAVFINRYPRRLSCTGGFPSTASSSGGRGGCHRPCRH